MINMLSLELNLIKIWAEILFFSDYFANADPGISVMI